MDKHDKMAVGVVEPIGDWHVEAMLTRPGLPVGTLLYDASALRQVERETLTRIDIERLAALEHEQWAHWTKYMLENLTADNIARWTRQVDTEYGDLSESEKESDRRWAYRVVRSLSANELPTTQELADISTPVKLIDRDQSDGYVRVPMALLDACKTTLRGKEHRELVKWIEQAAEKGG